MTGPQPYPGDVGGYGTTPVYSHTFKDDAGRALNGTVRLTPNGTEGPEVRLVVVDGVADLSLLSPKAYRYLAELETPEGQFFYQTGVLNVSAYR